MLMRNDKHKSIKRILTYFFIALTGIFILLMAVNQSFFNWAFDRHHNILSWYIRPLIILPLCFFSYRRSSIGISATVCLGLTSMFWFPVPSEVDPQVMGFLEMEKAYLTTEWTLGKIMISSLVPITLGLLCFAFWKRSVKSGALMIVIIALLKIFWSVFEGGTSGMRVIIPAVIGLGICLMVVYIFLIRKRIH